MTKYLAESEKYKVTSEYESVYLHFKDKLDKNSIFIGAFYGDPDSAIISMDEQYLVVAGYGLIIYKLSNPFLENKPNNEKSGQYFELFTDPDNHWYINGLHQNWIDRDWKYFKFVSNESVYKMHSETFEVVKTSK